MCVVLTFAEGDVHQMTAINWLSNSHQSPANQCEVADGTSGHVRYPKAK
jgi:hypothetical protein